MATDPVTASGALTPHDRFLVEKTEEAIRDGVQLDAWCRRADREQTLRLVTLELGKPFRLRNKAEGFLGELVVNGKTLDVMGAIQTNWFGSTSATPDQIREFVFRDFLPMANWTYPDGYPGGFTITQSLYRDRAGNYGKFSGADGLGMVDWRRLQNEYDWVLLTVLIHDFVMKFGPYTKRFDEAACVSPAAAFVHDVQTPGLQLDLTVGYPFVAYAPIPNNFGFGPGKFGVAIKNYTWQLRDNGELVVKMCFAAAPRCKKVFDFGPNVPDPVYGGAKVLKKLTLGAFPEQGFHDTLDLKMIGQHCRVHQALMDGVEQVWSDWSKAETRTGGAS